MSFPQSDECSSAIASARSGRLAVVASSLAGALCISGGALLLWLMGYDDHGDSADGLIADPMVFDLGSVAQGGSSTAKFRLKNSSDSPLEILAVETACSCTEADSGLGGRILAAYEEVLLPITFNVGRNRGQTSTTAVVTYRQPDESSRKMLTLRLAADVEPEIIVEPSTVRFAPGSLPESQIVLSPGVIESFELVNARCSHRAFRVGEIRRDAGCVIVPVSFDPSLWRADSKQAKVSLYTTGVVQSLIEIPLVPEL